MNQWSQLQQDMTTSTQLPTLAPRPTYPRRSREMGARWWASTLMLILLELLSRSGKNQESLLQSLPLY